MNHSDDMHWFRINTTSGEDYIFVNMMRRRLKKELTRKKYWAHPYIKTS
jgi:hypothetical protein